MFNFTNESEHLLNIATKDKATDVIKESLLNARKIGQKQLEDFVKDRLVLKNEEPLISNQVFVCSLWLLCDSLNPLGLHRFSQLTDMRHRVVRERPPTQCCRSSCYPYNSTPFVPVALSHS
jgi:hypothetical protein